MEKQTKTKEAKLISRTSIYLSRPKQKAKEELKQTTPPRKHRLPANKADNSMYETK